MGVGRGVGVHAGGWGKFVFIHCSRSSEDRWYGVIQDTNSWEKEWREDMEKLSGQRGAVTCGKWRVQGAGRRAGSVYVPVAGDICIAMVTR